MATIVPTRERDSCLTVGTTIAVVSNRACLVYASHKTAACKGQGQLPSFASPATIVPAWNNNNCQTVGNIVEVGAYIVYDSHDTAGGFPSLTNSTFVTVTRNAYIAHT